MPPSSAPPSVSVVIPAYDRADTIGAAVRSVLRQSVRDIEVIVVDDASTDATARIVEAMDDPRLRLIRHPVNKGGAAARNTGIEAARGAWVAFQDSDDEWLPEKLARQRAALAARPDAIGVYCGMIILGRPDADGYDPSRLEYRPPNWPGVPLEGDLAEALLVSGSLISTQTFMGRRDALIEAGGFDAGLKALQDWDLFIRFARLGPIAFEPEPLVLQRFSGNSLTRAPRNRAAAFARILEKNAEALAARPRAHAEHLRRLAGMRRMQGDLAGARRALSEALRRDPAAPRIWLGLAALAAAALRGGPKGGSKG